MGFFSAKCTSLARLDGKTAIITGCNTGIGKCTVQDFFSRGGRVVMACRNLEKANEAAESIKEDCKNKENLGEIVVTELDLSSFKSIRNCARRLLSTEKRIDVLVNNAGVMMCPETKTEDGFELQFGTNHLGHFLLTLLLLPKICQSTPARIVNVSSTGHTGSVLQTLNEEDENENFIVIMESYKSPFARLLEDSNALEYWNTFIEKSEEEQLKIIRAFSDKFCDNNLQSVHKSNKHGRLSSRIRHTIKIKKNLSLEVVKGLEEDLIKFFKTTPQNKYIRSSQTSFDRLLVHAAAQYHKLKSISVLDEEKGKRSVEVYNTHTDWTPADYFLADFIKELRR